MPSHLSNRERAKKKRRETILKAAENLFLHQGIDNTTMDEIAKEAEIGIATLFRYFPKKELIIQEVATAKLRILLGALKEIEECTSTCMEMMTAVMDFFIDQMAEQDGAMPKLLDNFVNYKAVAIDSFDDLNMYNEMRDEISIVFTRMIETRKNDGTIKQELRAAQIISTILSNFSVFTFKLSLKGNEDLPAPEITSEEQLVIMKRIFLDYLKS